MENTTNNNNLTSKEIKSLFFYEFPVASKKDIYKNNNRKTGIYLWTHKASGKKYVGSSLNISQRLVKYFSRSCLLREKERNQSAIYRAILKYGLSEFSFEIVEHCEPSILIEREQYYIDLIDPEYNILKFAGNRQGFIHSEATKELQRKARLGTVLSERTKLIMSNSNPKSTAITVYNKEINETYEFSTIRKAAEFFGVSHSQIIYYIKNQKLFRGMYSIKKKDPTE